MDENFILSLTVIASLAVILSAFVLNCHNSADSSWGGSMAEELRLAETQREAKVEAEAKRDHENRKKSLECSIDELSVEHEIAMELSRRLGPAILAEIEAAGRDVGSMQGFLRDAAATYGAFEWDRRRQRDWRELKGMANQARDEYVTLQKELREAASLAQVENYSKGNAF